MQGATKRAGALRLMTHPGVGLTTALAYVLGRDGTRTPSARLGIPLPASGPDFPSIKTSTRITSKQRSKNNKEDHFSELIPEAWDRFSQK